MKVLIIDSHNANIPDYVPLAPHLRISLMLQDMLDADLVTLPKHLEPLVGTDYDKIIFIHASAYSKSSHFINFILDNCSNPKYFYMVNDQALGESLALWALCRDYGASFECIANHYPEASKVVQKNVSKWHMVNLNSLVFDLSVPRLILPDEMRMDCGYFGAFRSGRLPYYDKYFTTEFPVSTSKKNIVKYEKHGLYAKWVGPLKWYKVDDTLHEYRSTLYIEDMKTNNSYSYMATRYYEALTYGIPTFFDRSCMNTIEKSGYPIDEFYIVDSKEELAEKASMPVDYMMYVNEQRFLANEERNATLEKIQEIVYGL